MAGVLLKLKLRLLLNRAAALRRDPRRAQAAFLAVLLVGYLVVRYGRGVSESLLLAGALPDPGPIFAQLSFSLVLLWVVLPLIYGGRRDLDLRNFQLLPVRPLTLAGGLAATFLLSPGAWLTVAVSVALAASFPAASAHLPLLGPAGLALVLMCTVTGQIVSTGADLLGRQRHARDLLALLTFVLAAVPVAMFFVLRSQFAHPLGGAGAVGPFAWVPPAWPGVAMAAASQGRTGLALAALGGSLVVIGLGVRLWTALISRAMLAQDSSTIRDGGSQDPFAGFARWLPGNRCGAVAASELRLLWREPARLPGVVIATVVFGVCSVSYVAVARRLNEVGIHSSALWMNVVARGRASSDLLGRDLAGLVVDLPVLLFASAVIAIDRGEVKYVVPALILGCASLAAAYAGMRVVNVKLARGEPRSKDTAAGRARPDPVVNVVSLLTWIVVVAPVFAAAAVPAVYGADWLYLTVPAAVVYAGGLWYGSLRWIGPWLDQHQAELLVRIGSA